MRTLICNCDPLTRCKYHGAMMRTISDIWRNSRDEALMEAIYDESDAYGERGYVPSQGYDWSGIRDSSPEAVECMYAVALDR